MALFQQFQVDFNTTESVVNVDWENGFVEASAKYNDNVNKVGNISKIHLY